VSDAEGRGDEAFLEREPVGAEPRAGVVELAVLEQVERASAAERADDQDQPDRVDALGLEAAPAGASSATASPPTMMPMAIVSPCQAMVIGPSSIVGSIPIVITAGSAVTDPAY
jgi:hypothetical protein